MPQSRTLYSHISPIGIRLSGWRQPQVPFVGLWLDTPESELIARSARRRFGVSDADASVIRNQLAEGTGPIGWHRLDASSSPEDVLQKAILVLGERLKGGTIRSESRAA